MEMKTSSLKPGGLSPPDCDGDPEEKEVSDDDDDDRNHKHRRRETRSQSMEKEQAEQVFPRPYRKWNKPFENGHFNRDNDSQPHYNFDRDPKFEKRRFSRFPSELNQRMMVNPPFSSDIAYGRGRDWNHHDSRFNAADAYQMAPPAIFTRRGLPNLTNAQNASWNAFGPMPGIPNGGIDAIHPIGLQGTLRPPINPSVAMGIPRQRCRDFEEQGFCLRGDMCPLEHGVNRIVVEDVQSLSQFNLPVSLPSAHLLTTPGSGLVAPANASTATLINGRNLHRPSKLRSDDGLSLGGGQSGEIDVSVADVYDPDQPLWNNDCPEASTAFLGLQPPNIDESDSYVDADPSDRVIQSSGTIGSQSTSSSVWGRIRTTKSRSELNEKIDAEINTSEYLENKNKHNHEASHSVRGTSFQAKPINMEEFGAKAGDPSSKMPTDAGHSVRNLSQKAQRTLFVNRIPLKDNKKETLLSHFRKFGEVIHIYIPANTERAFVQFSKKEDAERALKASDAVMGNRFIKLWWANRDRIPDDGGGTSALLTSCNLSAAPVANHPAVTNKVKATLQFPTASVNLSSASKGSLTASDDGKAVAGNGPKAAPPSQKELERLEMLKEIHKKQKMLDQKRDEFRRQLDKLEKKDVGTKGDVLAEVPAKRLKVEIADNSVKSGCPRSTDPSVARASSLAELSADKSQSEPNGASRSFRATLPTTLQEPSSLKQPFRPSVNAGGSFVVNRYKLDNRPTGFKVSPPLPSDLANVDALRDHFAPYGDLSGVELDYLDIKGVHDGVDDANVSKCCSAHIRFKARQAAERAFLNGKTWHGHNLQFTWLAPGSSSSGKKENSPAPKELTMEVPSTEKQAHSTSQGSSNVRGNSLVAVKEPQGAEVQSAEKSAYAMSLDSSIGTENSASVIKGTSSGADAQSACYIPLESNESEEGEESGIEPSEAEKDVQSSHMLVSGKIQSPKDEMC